jgi:hypothetical protein
MFQETRPDPEFPDDEDRTIMDVCLSSIRSLIRQKIRVTTISRFGKRDGIGVLLFNTRYRSPVVTASPATTTNKNQNRREESGELRQNHGDDDEDEEDEHDVLMGYQTLYSTVHELLPLTPPGIPTVRKIAATLPDFMGERQVDIQAEYACGRLENQENDSNDNDDDTEPSLHQALVRVLRILETSDCVKKDDASKILILTNNDHPLEKYSKTSEIWRILQTTISNIRDHGIDIAVWPVLGARKIVDTRNVNKVGKDHPSIVFSSFDFSKCYNKLKLSSSFSSCLDKEELDHQTWTYSPSETDDDDWVNHLLDERWKKPRRAFRVSLVWPDWKIATTTKNDGDDNDNPFTYMALDFFRLLQTMEMPSKKQIHQQSGR